MQEHSTLQIAQTNNADSIRIATMETRQNVAELTIKVVESAFESGEPYRNSEVFRNLFDVDSILNGEHKFILQIDSNRFSSSLIAGSLARVYANRIHYFNFKGDSLIEKIARACEFESRSGNEDKIPAVLQDYFEKMLNIFCEIMLDEKVKMTSGYAMNLLVNVIDL